MKQNSTNLLNITIKPYSKKEILEQIIFYIQHPRDFIHIVSVNPENIVIAQKNKNFLEVLNHAQIQIMDGIGVLLGSSIVGIKAGERLTGVDLMQNLLNINEKMPLRVAFLGGRGYLAENIAKCYQEKYPQSEFFGTQGIKKIQNPTAAEEDAIFSIVSAMKPHIIFAAFGSPYQELWFWKHKDKLQGAICIGVGGAFDFISGNIRRAPKFIRALGLEWLFRLIIEPWRWKRQLKLISFVYLIIKQKIMKYGR